MIVISVAEMSTERHEDSAIQQCKSAALVLRDRVETDTASSELSRDVAREARQHVAVGEPRPMDEVPRRTTVIAHRIEVHHATRHIDHRRPDDAERIDIAAGQCRTRHRAANRGALHNLPGRCIQRVGEITFGRRDDQAALRP